MGEITTEEWKERKKRKKAQMTAMQNLPYEVKVKRAELRAREFIERLDDMGKTAHVSVGGLDSITLLVFLRSIGLDIPAVSVSALEDKSIQKVHKELGAIRIAPGKSKKEILQEYGFPVISKRSQEGLSCCRTRLRKIKPSGTRLSRESAGNRATLRRTAG